MKTTFGRYIPGNSIIHQMNPILKIILNIFYIVMAFLAKFYITFAILLLPIMAMYIIATKKIRPLFRMLRAPIIIGIFIMFVNFYIMNSVALEPSIKYYSDISGLTIQEISNQHIWFSNVVTFSTFALLRTLTLIIRIYIMILVTTILTSTTKPIMLTKALEILMFPLKLLFIPTQIVAMIISIALRFIPTLLDEATRIMKAQSSRGVDFKNGKFSEKSRSLITLIIPLFVTSFTKADDLANAMETRGYDPYAKRTRYRKMNVIWFDYIVMFFIAGLLAFSVCSIVGVIDFPVWWKWTYSSF